jgi:hypothetical protein
VEAVSVQLLNELQDEQDLETAKLVARLAKMVRRQVYFVMQ